MCSSLLNILDHSSLEKLIGASAFSFETITEKKEYETEKAVCVDTDNEQMR
jgi:hypothetical protein